MFGKGAVGKYSGVSKLKNFEENCRSLSCGDLQVRLMEKLIVDTRP
jgi:hypothetical protein